MKFRNMKIGQRLALGFAGSVLFSALIAVTSIWKMNEFGSDMREITGNAVAKERLIADWSRNITSAVTRTTAVAKSSDTSLSTFFAADAAASSKSSSALIKKIEPLITSEEEKALFAKINENRKAYLSSRDAVFKLKAAGQAAEADKMLEETYLPVSKHYEEMVAQFLDLQRKQLDNDAQHAADTEATGKRVVAILTALVIVFCLACSWWLTTGITRPLRYMGGRAF